jgi:plastocyanin
MKRLLTICAITAFAAAGCGGDDNKSGDTASATTESTATETTPAATGGGGTELKLAADQSQLKFDKSALSAPAGKVTVTMTNPSGLSHNVAVEGNGVDQDGEVVGQGGTSTVTADLKAGTYTFYCSVDGHEAAGMKGTLTVK